MVKKYRLIVLFTVLLSIMFCLPVSAGGKAKLSKTNIEMYNNTSTNLLLLNSKSKVTWKIDNKKVLTIVPTSSKSAMIIAKKEGMATVTAISGKEKYKCEVHVKEHPFSTERTELRYEGENRSLVWEKVSEASGYQLNICRIKGANAVTTEEILLSANSTEYVFKDAESEEQYISIIPFMKVRDGRIYGKTTSINLKPVYE